MRLSNASTFRRYASAEDSMMRAAMPRTSAADQAPIVLRRAADRTGRDRTVSCAPALAVSIAERMVVYA